ncbi:MAG: hypothetical protein GTN81_01730 [Proteobacteria bacterium]|nr:hypothetical protein [Pseudomonadota bacterium]
MGLIQRTIEAAGIPTISISLNREITAKVNPPRVLVVDFPLGHPMGNPFQKELQRQILREALNHLAKIREPGTIVDLKDTYRIQGGECKLCAVEVG